MKAIKNSTKRKIISSEYNNIQKRMSAPVSFVKGAKSNKILRPGRLVEVFQGIKSDADLKAFSERLTILKENDDPGYSKLKEKECPGFIIGSYKIRKDDSCDRYVPLIGFDIDKIEDFFSVRSILVECRKDPKIFAAFPSPSMRGLRILVWCDSTFESHKEYYSKICNHLSASLGIGTDKSISSELKKDGATRAKIKAHLSQTVHIDTSTSNVSRIWFYGHLNEEDIYLNGESEVFSLEITSKEDLKPLPLSPVKSKVKYSQNEKLEFLDKMTDSSSGRNNRVLALASKMFENSFDKSTITNYLKRYKDPNPEDPFMENEILKIINNAEKLISRNGKMGMYSDEQLENYISKVVPGKDEKLASPSNEVLKTINDIENSNNHNIEERSKEVDGEDKPKITKIREILFKKYDFRLNLISIEIETSKKNQNNWKPLNENDLIVELLEYGFKGVEGPLVALLKSRYVPIYDPLIYYFKTLPSWDESKPDYISQLASYVDTSDNEWFLYQFKKMLVRLIACAINLIPFNKHSFTLVGKQNDGKTTFIRFLCPTPLRDYFKENIDIHNKDGRLALCQNLIINLDELANFSRYDINKTKAFLTIDRVKERLPYDRKNSTFERRASFFASTNSSEFLTDETGNVRWLIFEVNSINHDNGGKKGYVKNIDIDNVYSQAYALLKSGFEYKLTKEDINKSEVNNKQFQVISLEEELIQECFLPGENIPECEFFTASGIQREIETMTKSKVSNRQIGKALKNLGFKQAQKYFTEEKYQKKGYWVKKINSTFQK